MSISKLGCGIRYIIARHGVGRGSVITKSIVPCHLVLVSSCPRYTSIVIAVGSRYSYMQYSYTLGSEMLGCESEARRRHWSDDAQSDP